MDDAAENTGVRISLLVPAFGPRRCGPRNGTAGSCDNFMFVCFFFFFEELERLLNDFSVSRSQQCPTFENVAVHTSGRLCYLQPMPSGQVSS